MNQTNVNINLEGFLVTHKRDDESRRTYACANRSALDSLIFYLTGRAAGTYPIDDKREGDLPAVPNVAIAAGLQIWGTSIGRPAVVYSKENCTVEIVALGGGSAV